jgi:hypothetical protein
VITKWQDVRCDLWSDPRFEALSPQAKLLYLWSISNAHCNLAGLYKVSKRTIAFESSVPDIDTTLVELEKADLVYYRAPWLFVKWRVAELRSKGPKHAKNIAHDIAELPPGDELRERWLTTYGAWLEKTLPDTPSIPHAKGPIDENRPAKTSDGVEIRTEVGATRTSANGNRQQDGAGRPASGRAA